MSKEKKLFKCVCEFEKAVGSEKVVFVFLKKKAIEKTVFVDLK